MFYYVGDNRSGSMDCEVFGPVENWMCLEYIIIRLFHKGELNVWRYFSDVKKYLTNCIENKKAS